jgi:hypothetical protein
MPSKGSQRYGGEGGARGVEIRAACGRRRPDDAEALAAARWRGFGGGGADNGSSVELVEDGAAPDSAGDARSTGRCSRRLDAAILRVLALARRGLGRSTAMAEEGSEMEKQRGWGNIFTCPISCADKVGARGRLPTRRTVAAHRGSGGDGERGRRARRGRCARSARVR